MTNVLSVFFAWWNEAGRREVRGQKAEAGSQKPKTCKLD